MVLDLNLSTTTNNLKNNFYGIIIMPIIICSRCANVWDYKGDHRYATCPSCLSKVKVYSPSPNLLDLGTVLNMASTLERGGGKLSKEASDLILKLKEVLKKEIEDDKVGNNN